MPKKKLLCMIAILSITLSTIIAAVKGEESVETPEVLKERLQKAPGVDKSGILNKLARAYFWDDQKKEEVLAYSRQALRYARMFNHKDQEIHALANMGHASRRLNDYNKALEFASRGLQMAEELADRRPILYVLDILGDIHSNIPDFESARRAYNRALDISRELGDRKGAARYMDFIEGCYSYEGKFFTALKYAKETLRMYQELGDKENTLKMIVHIGNIYLRIGNKDDALKHYLDAVRIGEKEKMAEQTAWAYQSIGRLYRQQNKHEKALEYFDQSFKLFENKYRIAVLLIDMAKSYNALGSFEQALEHLDKALKIRLEIDNSGRNGPADIFLNMGDVFFKERDYEKALEYYNKALELATRFKEYHTAAFGYKNIGSLYFLKSDWHKALENFFKSLEIAKRSGENPLILENYQSIANAYSRLGRYKKALDYFRSYAALKDKIYNETSADNVAEMQTRYETERKEKEIEILKKNNRIQELVLNRQKLTRNVSIIISILLLIIFLQFIRRYRYLFAFWKKKSYIAHYKLLAKINSGGMGTIYRAHDMRSKPHSSTCAIKLLKEEYYKDEKYRRRFRNEAALIDQFNHKNIVTVMERGEFEGNLYIAMELLEGETLAERLEKGGAIELKTALSFMVQAADALAEVHKRGIIHRDLKPENIMIIQRKDNPFHIKILDFGLARTQNLTRMTRTGMIMGTIFYAAPEQLTKSSVSAAGDIYSLGVIYYQVLTGARPFSSDTAFHIARQILKSEPLAITKFKADIPAPLAALVKRMMAKDPERRPAAEEVMKQLKEIEKSLSLTTS